MSHVIRQKEKLLKRVRRIRGQVDAVERALEGERECSEVLHVIAAARGAINSLMSEVLEDHIRFHSRIPGDANEELIDILRSYLK
jgi:DNA-binding FrmR family transcriptional regulator